MPKRDLLRRLLLIHERVSEGAYPSAQSLALELEVKPRVIWNDREYMKREFKAPIALDRKRGGWYYTEPTFSIPSLLISRGELIAFFLAVEATRNTLGEGMQNELLVAVEKIGRALRSTVEVDFETLRQHVSFAVPLTVPFPMATMTSLRTAIELQRQVGMTYFAASRGETRRRIVEPHHLYSVDGDWYLVAFDRVPARFRTFLIARIKSLQVMEQGFARQENFDPAHFTKSGFRAESGPQTHQITIRFAPTQAPYILEKSWHATEQKVEQLDGSLILSFESSGLGQVCRWVLQHGPRAEVISPPELRGLVAKQVEEMARIYGGNGHDGI